MRSIERGLDENSRSLEVYCMLLAMNGESHHRKWLEIATALNAFSNIAYKTASRRPPLRIVVAACFGREHAKWLSSRPLRAQPDRDLKANHGT